MYIFGSFINKKGSLVSVHIVTGNDMTVTREIGTDEAGIWFTTDPVEITSECNDTFDHLLRHSAVVRLQARGFESALFCTSCQDAVVNIYRDDECLFAGFVEPMSWSQPYADVFDEVELNCIDVLTALQYSKYKNVGSSGVIYQAVKNAASQRSFYTIITEMLDGATSAIDIEGNHTLRYLFDGSISIDSQSANHYTILRQLLISDLLFLGDDEDGVWQQDVVLEEMLKFLNLHVVQIGFTFYLFSWSTMKAPGAISWRDIKNGQIVSTSHADVTITQAIAADTDTNLSICETYNQLSLTCEVEEMVNVIENPLDSSRLTSPYNAKQLYCTEYAADGEGERAYNAFWSMLTGEATDYEEGKVTDWYVRVMRHPQWSFPVSGDTDLDLVDLYCQNNENQQALLNWLGSNIGAAIISAGTISTNTVNKDNSPVSKVDMTNYLVVSVNGYNSHYKWDNPVANTVQQTGVPTEATLQSSIPVAIYTGAVSGGNYSPSDGSTTNYIVISGSLVLNPRAGVTRTYGELQALDHGGQRRNIWHDTTYSRNNDDGRYNTRRYYKAATPKAQAETDSETEAFVESMPSGTSPGLELYSGDDRQRFEFKYSAIGDLSDHISKVGVLACMLIIGDKCVVESGYQGQPSDFSWQTYKTMAECSDVDEYYGQSFTIGFDPKIGDKIIGTEFDIQNNISYQMGIEVDGMAIPIHSTDKVNGQVKFIILGPVNATWAETTRRHPTFFRHTSWDSTTYPLLPFVSNILIKNFEMKVYSDNGLNESLSDNDIVYLSDTVEQFVNKKDDLQMKIHSALTSEECATLGVKNVVAMSVPVNTVTENGVLSLYDRATDEQAKAEKIYVDSYYKEYHAPRIIMEQLLEDDGSTVSMFNHYTHPALGKEMFVMGVSRNLMEGTAGMKLKEIES
jgi:hypothetical protein